MEALAMGRPEIFNTDQGCQFTSPEFQARPPLTSFCKRDRALAFQYGTPKDVEKTGLFEKTDTPKRRVARRYN